MKGVVDFLQALYMNVDLLPCTLCVSHAPFNWYVDVNILILNYFNTNVFRVKIEEIDHTFLYAEGLNENFW